MMKMILIITNKDDVTVDFIVKEMQARDIQYYRLNTEDIPDKIHVNFDLNENTFEIVDKIKNIKLNLLDFSSVYYRRPLISDFNYVENASLQELSYLRSEITYVLEGIYKVLRNKYWLNNVYSIREAENKIYQLQMAREVGFKIPNSLISNEVKQVYNQKIKCNNDCIIKPIKSGNMKDVQHPKVVFTSKLIDRQLENTERIESFPVFIQENVHKQFDLRITVIGNTVYTAQIHSQLVKDSEVDWRKGQQILEHSNHELPIKVVEMCIALTKKMNLNYSAIDMILDKNGDYIFLEINPNGQWAWIEKRLGFPLSKRIVDMLFKEGESSVD